MKKIILSCIILSLCASLCLADNASGQKKDKRLIIVSGTDYVETLPDTAYVNIVVSLEKDTPEEAAAVGDALKKNIAQAIRTVGIEKKDILEDATGLSDRSDYSTKKTVSIYTYTSRLRITDFALIAAVRKELLNERTFEPAKESWFSKRGLSVDMHVRYEVVSQKNRLEREALKKACDNALAKIRTLAEANELKFIIDRIEEVSSISEPYRQPRMYAAMAKMERNDPEGAGAEDTIPTLQRITSQVTLAAEIQ